MYRLFYQGKYQGEYKNYPWVHEQLYPAYVMNMRGRCWILQKDTGANFVNPEEVPKEYLVLNLLL